MKRKLIFLSSLEYSKDVVDRINGYFDKGYEIEDILDADCGYYILLVLKCIEKYKFALSDSKFDFNKLIEEDKKPTKQNWVTSNTDNIILS